MKCVVTDFVEPDLDWESDVYREAGIVFESHQLRHATPDVLGPLLSDADVIIVDQANISEAVVEHLKRCKLIIRHGDGYDNLDIGAATSAGIAVANKPGFWSQEVAEFAFSLGLASLRKIPVQQAVAAERNSGDATWNLARAMPQHRLSSRVIGVLGFGRIGREVARLYSATCSEVLVHDSFVNADTILKAGCKPVSWSELLRSSDLISIHVPATEETRGLFNDGVLSAMKSGSVLVNTARGTIVNTDNLLDALSSGQLAAVALDTTDPEPLDADHALFSMKNAIITPHMGWYTEEAMWAMRQSIAKDVLGVLGGKTPESIVNGDVFNHEGCRMKDAGA